MVTAKNLQLLDTQGNNISPAVNIETIYYEYTADTGNKSIVKRNHLFKHFPVYVKYNGRPDLREDGTDVLNDDFYLKEIYPYEAYEWPKTANVTHHPIINSNLLTGTPTVNEDYELIYNSSLAGDTTLHDYTIEDSPADIYVSGIRQTPFGNGTDFMRLDISTYNLSEILYNYAHKDWVKLRLDYYNTKIENNNIFDSSVCRNPDKIRENIYTTKKIGNLPKNTNIDNEINGKTYNQILDKIISGPIEPKIHNGCIDITTNSCLFITDEEIKRIGASLNSYLWTNFTNKTIRSSTTVAYKLRYFPKWQSFYVDEKTYIQQPNIVDNITLSHFNESTDINLTTSLDKRRVEVQVPISIYKFIVSNKKEYILCHMDVTIPEYENMVNVYNSAGIKLNLNNSQLINNYINNVRININDGTKEIDSFKFGNISLKIKNSTETTNASIKNTGYNFKRIGRLYYPIKYGHTLYSLKTQYIEAGKYDQIMADWDPVKTFYVCVPRILVSQLSDPFPKLKRILAQSRWQETTNWVIGGISPENTVTNVKETKTQDLTEYIVYTIPPVGLGATRKIKFGLDLTLNNLIENLYNKQAKTNR